ncbi:UNVERIFIED_CONTAM: hypothetical protein FKN15_001246 [Acipenser sinensis]
MKSWQNLRRQRKAKLATQHRPAAGPGEGLPSTSQLTPLERQAERTIHPKQTDPGFEYARSSLSCPSPLKVFLPVLNKSQASLHQEVYHSSHPEASDRSLNCNYLHLVRGGTKFLEDQQLPKCKAKSLHLIIMLAAA